MAETEKISHARAVSFVYFGVWIFSGIKFVYRNLLKKINWNRCLIFTQNLLVKLFERLCPFRGFLSE